MNVGGEEALWVWEVIVMIGEGFGLIFDDDDDDDDDDKLIIWRLSATAELRTNVDAHAVATDEFESNDINSTA